MKGDKQFKFLSVRTGLIAMLVAPVIALLPFIGIPLGFLFCGPDANEVSCAWGLPPLLLLLTLVQVGLYLFVAGFVVLIISLVKKTGSKKDV